MLQQAIKEQEQNNRLTVQIWCTVNILYIHLNKYNKIDINIEQKLN